MEPTTRIHTYKRKIIDPTGPSLDLMDNDNDEENKIESENYSSWRCWKKNKSTTTIDETDPKDFSTFKKNTILFIVAVGGAM